MKEEKPLGQKAYGSIAHLPGSRMGPADHHCHEGQARIATEKKRDKHDLIIVQEKLDGSCCSVARINGEIIALGRSGYMAKTSPYLMHHYFHDWVELNKYRFKDVLKDGERIVGEWLAQAHGTRYELKHEPYVVFDLMTGTNRLTVEELENRISGKFVIPHILSRGEPFSIQAAIDKLSVSAHGAIDPVEGAVWRVERKGKVDFLCKYVRPDKKDGCYLKNEDGTQRMEIWNWKP